MPVWKRANYLKGQSERDLPVADDFVKQPPQVVDRNLSEVVEERGAEGRSEENNSDRKENGGHDDQSALRNKKPEDRKITQPPPGTDAYEQQDYATMKNALLVCMLIHNHGLKFPPASSGETVNKHEDTVDDDDRNDSIVDIAHMNRTNEAECNELKEMKRVSVEPSRDDCSDLESLPPVTPTKSVTCEDKVQNAIQNELPAGNNDGIEMDAQEQLTYFVEEENHRLSASVHSSNTHPSAPVSPDRLILVPDYYDQSLSQTKTSTPRIMSRIDDMKSKSSDLGSEEEHKNTSNLPGIIDDNVQLGGGKDKKQRKSHLLDEPHNATISIEDLVDNFLEEENIVDSEKEEDDFFDNFYPGELDFKTTSKNKDLLVDDFEQFKITNETMLHEICHLKERLAVAEARASYTFVGTSLKESDSAVAMLEKQLDHVRTRSRAQIDLLRKGQRKAGMKWKKKEMEEKMRVKALENEKSSIISELQKTLQYERECSTSAVNFLGNSLEVAQKERSQERSADFKALESEKKSTIKDLENEIKLQKEFVETLQTGMKQLTKSTDDKTSEYEEKIKMAEHKNEEQQIKLRSLEEKNMLITDEHKLTKEKIDGCKKEFETKYAQLQEESRASIQNLEKKLVDLNKIKENLECDVTMKTLTISTYQSEQRTSDKGKRDELQKCKDELKMTHEENLALTDQIVQLENSINLFQSGSQREEVDALKRDLDTTRKTLEASESMVTSLKTEIVQINEESRASIEALESRLEDRSTTIARLELDLVTQEEHLRTVKAVKSQSNSVESDFTQSREGNLQKDDLKRRLDLEAHNMSLIKTIDAFRATFEEPIKKENQETVEALKMDLAASIKKHQITESGFESQLTAFDDSKRLLLEELRNKDTTIDTLENRLSEFESQIESLEESKRLLLEELRKKETTIDTLKNRLSECVSQTESLEESKQHLREDSHSKDTIISTLDSNISLKNRLSQSESQLESLEESKQHLLEDLRKKDVTIDTLKNRLSDVESQLESLEESKQHLLEDLHRKDTTIDTLGCKISLDNKLSESESQLESLEESKQHLLEDSRKKYVTIDTLKNRLSDVESQLAFLQDSKHHLLEDLRKKEMTISTLISTAPEENHAQARDMPTEQGIWEEENIAELELKLKKSQQKMAAQEAELVVHKESLLSFRSEMRFQMSKYEQEIRSGKEEKKLVQQACEDLTEQLHIYEKEKERLQQELLISAGRIANQEQDLRNLMKDLKNTSTSNGALREQVSTLRSRLRRANGTGNV